MTKNVNVTYKLSEEHNKYKNLTVFDRFADGEAAGWRVDANEGYVFHDTTENSVEINPETMEETPVTYYYGNIHLPRRFDWANFSLVAVPRDSVDDRFIF